MVMGIIVGFIIVAAGVATYKLWKSGSAITGKSVAKGAKKEVKKAVKAAKPGVIALAKALIAKLFRK